MKETAPGTDGGVLTELRAFVGVLRDAALRERAIAQAENLSAAYTRIKAHSLAQFRQRMAASNAGKTGEALNEVLSVWESGEGGALRPIAADFGTLDRATDDVLTTLRTRRRAFEQVHNAIEIDYLRQALEDLRASGTALYHRERADRATALTEEVRDRNEWNARDARMADNLRWLIQQRYAGRKVIVWAHNAHIMKSYFSSNWASVHATLPRDGLKPTGAWTAEWLRDGLYSIALTTFEGEENWANYQRRGSIAPAPAGSLEWRLHQLGMPQLFLDLRAAGRDRGHPLRTPLSLRVSGYGKPTSNYGNDTLQDVTKAFDAILFIDQMAPATPVQLR